LSIFSTEIEEIERDEEEEEEEEDDDDDEEEDSLFSSCKVALEDILLAVVGLSTAVVVFF